MGTYRSQLIGLQASLTRYQRTWFHHQTTIWMMIWTTHLRQDQRPSRHNHIRGQILICLCTVRPLFSIVRRPFQEKDYLGTIHCLMIDHLIGLFLLIIIEDMVSLILPLPGIWEVNNTVVHSPIIKTCKQGSSSRRPSEFVYVHFGRWATRACSIRNNKNNSVIRVNNTEIKQSRSQYADIQHVFWGMRCQQITEHDTFFC